MLAEATVVDGMMRGGACRAAMDAVLRRVVWQAQRQRNKRPGATIAATSP